MMPNAPESAPTARRSSKPDISGRSTSRSMTSGSSDAAASIADLPQAASPTTCMSSLRRQSRIRLSRRSAWSSTINIFKGVLGRGSSRSGTHCRWKTGLRTEIAFDGFHLIAFQPKVLHVAERLAVLGSADVHHKGVVAVCNHALEVKAVDKIDLRLPTPRFEGTFVDVIVVVRAREREVIREQQVDRTPILFLPCRIPFAEGGLVFRHLACVCVCARHRRGDHRRSQRAGTGFDHRPARHCTVSHDAFLPWFIETSEKGDVTVRHGQFLRTVFLPARANSSSM